MRLGIANLSWHAELWLVCQCLQHRSVHNYGSYKFYPVLSQVGIPLVKNLTQISIHIETFHAHILVVFIGMGFGPATLSIFTVTVRYFSTRRNLAIQIMCMGSAFGAFIFCPIYQILINIFAWRGAFQVFVCLRPFRTAISRSTRQ